MAVTNLKRAALDALAAALADHLTALGATALAANCKAVESDWEEQAAFPSLRVLAEKMTFEPASDDDEVDDTQANKLVVDIGCVTGTAELRLGFRSPAEREALEPLVADLFNQTEDMRGAVTVQITGGLTLPGGTTAYEPTVTFMRTDEDWIDEKVFDKRRYSSLLLDVSLPILALRSVVGDMDTVILAFTQDFATDATAVETTQIAIDQDGNLTTA